MTSRIRTAIETTFEAGPLRGQGKIRNVGEGGLFVGTPVLPAQGETVKVSFRDGRGHTLALSGLVWWTTDDDPGTHRASGFGMRLLDCDDEYERFLAGLAH